ncbi:MAG TPA: DVUA0089 family protein [Armatimonadota bacterium]|nr:DVUA0089 family protein [Armatimonadota bacterium]
MTVVTSRARCLRIFILGFCLALAPIMATAADSREPDNQPAQARTIPTDGTAQAHTIDPADDVDWVKFTVAAGAYCTMETAASGGSPVNDTVIYLYGSNGTTQLAEDDDGGTGLYSRLTGTFSAAGTYYLKIESYQHRYTGGYSVSVTASGGGGQGDGVVTRRAVCVGISDYAGIANDLSYCDDDARDFAAALAAGSNWSAANIQTIVDRQAVAANIWAALNAMAAASDADDQCVFFYSGHGTRGSDLAPLDEGGGYDEYLVESDMADNIRDDELGNWVAGLPTSNVLVVLCSCYSGGFIKGVGGKGLGPDDPVAPANGFAADVRAAMDRRAQVQPLDIDDAGRGVVLTAADDDETCQESSELAHDVFNFYLLQGMAGPADSNSDRWIAAEEMYAWANPRATQYNSSQHAQIYDAQPATAFRLVNLGGGQPRTVTITNGPWGDPDAVAPGAQMRLNVIATESQGGGLTYLWSVRNAAGNSVGSLNNSTAASPLWTAPGNNSGQTRQYTASVTVRSAADPSVSDQGSFTARVMTTLSRSFSAGVSMIGIPGVVDPGGQSLEQLVGASSCVMWNPDTQAYRAAGPPTQMPAQGEGCWANFSGARSVQLVGLPSTSDSFLRAVKRGWNIMALPWNQSVHIAGMTSLPEGRIPQAAWTYYSGGYHLVANVSGLSGVTDQLDPWRSYWINASANCNVSLDRTVQPAAASAAVKSSANDWIIRVLACSGDGTSASAWCGVSALGDAGDVAAPPAAPTGVSMSLVSADGAKAVDLTDAQAATRYEWEIELTGVPQGTPLSLSWPDLSAVPGRYRLYLADRDADRTLSMRTAGGYTCAGAGDAPRRLTLRAVADGSASLALTGVSSAQVSAAQATVTYTLSAPAEVTVRVLNIAGRIVAELSQGLQAESGLRTAAWDLRAVGGAPVPAGMYLVRVTARAEDGTQASAVSTLAIRR